MKTIIVGVTSSIAAYKSVQLVSDLLKKGYDVEVIMSENATKFIAPLSFSSLTKHKTYVDTFDREVDYQIEHISLAKKADAFILAPATANIIAKVANGLADDMLTTTFLASTCPKLIAPAMNTNMLNNPITQRNIETCIQYGMHIIDTDSGLLACGDVGSGKLASIDAMIDAIEEVLHTNKPLDGKHVLVSAGPTITELDPVRFITNHSSGKMGYAIAKAARNMGATVTLVSGPTSLQEINNIKTVHVNTVNEMSNAMKSNYEKSDYVIMAAAVGDFAIEKQPQKIKKKGETIQFNFTPSIDILKYLGEHKTKQVLCGFAMESEDIINNAKQKLINKNCDMLVVNSILEDNAGFQADTNKVTILNKDGSQIDVPFASKEDIAYTILDTLVSIGE